MVGDWVYLDSPLGGVESKAVYLLKLVYVLI